MIAGLVIRAHDGDRSAWEELVDRYARLIWAICDDYRLGESEAADVAQAVWLSLMKVNIDNPHMPADLGGWLAAKTTDECRRVRAAGKLSHAEQPADQAVSNLRARMRASVTGFSVRGLTGLAAFLAGREGLALLDESDGHLAGESGHDPLSWSKVKEAAGFIVAGVRYRCSDWADAGWRPADAVLRSRVLSNLFITIPTVADAVEVLRHEGTLGVLTSFGSIFTVGVMLYGLVKLGRWWRNVELPEPKARRAEKDGGT
jgi:hypothetical protein